jgi:hypothetical protein
MATNDVQGPYDNWSMVVLYDPKTGEIAHTHQAVTTRGGAHPDPAALEQLAADHAVRARNVPVDGMAFLHVDPREIDLGARYTVDVKSGSLVKAAPGEAKP